jgi:hypothetical protein
MKATCAALCLGFLLTTMGGRAATAQDRTIPPLLLATDEVVAPPYVPTASPPPAPTTDDHASRPITHRWWFWTAMGAFVAGTVTVAVLANRPASAPSSTLGNMEAFRRF